MVAWVFFVSAAHGFNGLVPMSELTDEYALAITLVLLAIPQLQRLPLPWLALLPLGLFVAGKAGLGGPLGGDRLAETLVDLVAIAITTLLALETARSVEEFCGALSYVTVGALRGRTSTIDSAQGQLYQEVRRARLGRQPLAVLAISPHPTSVAASRDRFVEEAMRSLLQDYVQGRVAAFLREQLRIWDTITACGDHLLTILPITTGKEAEEFARRIRDDAQERLGLDLAIGQASFPDEEVTLVGLLQRAEAAMRRRLDGEQEEVALPPVGPADGETLREEDAHEGNGHGTPSSVASAGSGNGSPSATKGTDHE
jgi:hypothetical protein